MPKYRVYAIISASKSLGEVEAPDKEKAIDMLADEASVTLCHHCSHEVDMGDAYDFEVEEVE